MPVKKISPKKVTKEWYLEMKAENKRKLDEILANPNYQEIIGRKYYGDNWMATLWGNHPEKLERTKENASKANRRLKGEAVPYKRTWNRIPIIQMDMDGKFIKEWDSAVHYCEANGMKARQGQTVSNAARGLAESAYNYKWKFKDEE